VLAGGEREVGEPGRFEAAAVFAGFADPVAPFADELLRVGEDAVFGEGYGHAVPS
jgi:hypothetical protein